MPLRGVEPPDAVRSAAAAHIYRQASARGSFPALRDVVWENLALVAPHRMYTLGLDSVLDSRMEGAIASGWRFLVADGERIVASLEVAGNHGESPLLNSGPYVASTAAAIDDLDGLPEVIAGDYEFRLLKVPALYIVAGWLIDVRRMVVPIAPAPSFLEAGAVYSEQEFLAVSADPARLVLNAPGSSGG